ncbi:hypothetical protein [Actinomadura rugatobispora]|uniref:Uncharacterized protein n=1 Tax=Actinomadura rugatobispora TaxID=1994 RepID=A0ABW0ZNB6_9ACTN
MTIIPDPKRAAYAQGLRDLADFLEAQPEVPLPSYPRVGPLLWGDDEDKRAEVERIASLLGVTPRKEASQHLASRYFGPVVYEVVAITAEEMERHRALHSYRDNVQPEPPALAEEPADAELVEADAELVEADAEAAAEASVSPVSYDADEVVEGGGQHG